MLKGIDPRLTPELLHALAAMGHGDCLTIVDANYPAHAAARGTPWGHSVDFGGTAPQALEAILSVMPIDPFDPERPPVQAMAQVDASETPAPAVAEGLPLIRAEGFETALVERFAFYAAAARSFVFVRTREFRPYGNFILRKGVILP